MLAERRERKRTKVWKVVLLILFSCMAVFATIGIVGALSIWSRVSEAWQAEQERHFQAFKAAEAQLARNGVTADPNDFDVEFYDDGCIVRGTGYSSARGTVRYDISIAIDETEALAVWTVETATLDGRVIYNRSD